MLRRLFFREPSKISLGRWEHRLGDTQKNIKMVWANSDHCGDTVCGDPKHIKDTINQINSNDLKIDENNVYLNNTSNTSNTSNK